jgi:hypothetical protein
MTSKFLGRTGIRRYPDCSFCSKPCEHEQYEVSHSFTNKEPETKHFCSLTCLRDAMGIEEHIVQEVESRTRQEFNWLHKQVCPSCRRRIISVV